MGHTGESGYALFVGVHVLLGGRGGSVPLWPPKSLKSIRMFRLGRLDRLPGQEHRKHVAHP